MEEIRRGIHRLRCGKAAGSSGIYPEMIKAGGIIVEDRLHSLFKKVWLTEVIPEDWQCGVVIPLHKKGDRMNLDNYRGITLMDVVGKVFSGIIKDRLEEFYNGRIAEEQAGFRKGRGCMDQGYILAQMVSKRLAVQKKTFLCFVDLKKAYDSIWRVGLRERLKSDGTPKKLVSLVDSWYRTVRARVKVNDVDSKWFESKIGLRQGDTLSPLLFNVFINGIVQKVAESEGGVLVGEILLQILLFADDMVLIAEDEAGLNSLMSKVKEYCDAWHLEVNVKKTKVMVVSKDGSEKAKVMYGEDELECVDEFSYLGITFSSDGKWEKEVAKRVQLSRAALSNISKQVIWNKNVSIGVKKVVFDAMVKSKIMYGAEVWWASKHQLDKLETVQNDFVRWISGYTRKDRKHVNVLRQDMGMCSIGDWLCSRRLHWLGHVIRMGACRLVSRVWGSRCEGRKGRG